MRGVAFVIRGPETAQSKNEHRFFSVFAFAFSRTFVLLPLRTESTRTISRLNEHAIHISKRTMICKRDSVPVSFLGGREGPCRE